MKRRSDFRLIPMLLIAIGCLSVLKIAGILLDGGYILVGEPQPQKLSWARIGTAAATRTRIQSARSLQ